MEAPRLHAGLVLIHGAGKEPSGYYRGFMASIGRHLGAEAAVLPAWWADLCNLGAAARAGGDTGAPDELGTAGQPAVAADPPMSKEAESFRRDYLRDLGIGVRGSRQAGSGETLGGRTAVRSVGGTLVSLADTANDVVQYMFNPRLRAGVQSRLLERLDEARRRFDRAILVSHSLGTVIAYDVLRQHAAAYNVQSWYTTGSPLARLARLGRVNTNVGQIGGGAISNWHNLFDAGDIVASALAGSFAFPINDVRVDNGGGVLNSHNYWGNISVAAMIADDLRRRYLRVPARAEEGQPSARPRRPRTSRT